MVAHDFALYPLFSPFFSSLAVSVIARLSGVPLTELIPSSILLMGVDNSALLEVVPHSSFLVLL